MFTLTEIQKMITRRANKGAGLQNAINEYEEICFRNTNNNGNLLRELYLLKFLTHGQFIKMIDSVYA
jgi:DNA anti-recombination protein RmuC